MKRTTLFLALAGLLAATSASAQTFKADFSTKIVLAGGGTNPVHTVTLATAPGGIAAITLTLPASYALGAGYLLTSDGAGNLSWTNPSLGVTLAGDVTGSAGSNSVVKLNGVALGTTTATSGNLLIGQGSSWATEPITGDVTITSGGVTAIGAGKVTNTDLVNSTIALGSTGGTLTVTGSPIALGTGLGNAELNLGHANSWTVGQTFTDITSTGTGTFNNFTATGTVTLPAGSVTASSLDLASGDIFIGDVTNHASAQAVTGDVTISASGVTAIGAAKVTNTDLVNSTIALGSTGGTLTVTGSPIALGTGLGNAELNLGHANSWTVGQTFTDITSTGTGTFNNFTATGTVTLPAGSVNASSLDLASGDIFIGDVTNHASAQAVTGDVTITASGVTAIGAAKVTNTDLVNSSIAIGSTGGTLTVTGSPIALGTGLGNAELNLGHANSWTVGQTFTDITSTGTGTFNNLTATGTVTLPAGSVTASSLGLASGDILIGDVTNHAAPQAVTGDVTISASGVTAIGAGKVTNTDLANSSIALGSTGGTLTVTNSPISLGGTAGNAELNLGHANTWTGTQTLGGVALTSATAVASNPTQANFALSQTNSYFLISAAAATTLSGISGGTAGRVIVLINTGSNPITLTSQDGASSSGNQFIISGGSAIMGQNGSVTMIYDATAPGNWRVISAH